MVKHDDEATVDLGRLNQTWKSRRGCPGSPGVPPAVAAFQAAWRQARTPAPQLLLGQGRGLRYTSPEVAKCCKTGKGEIFKKHVLGL